MMRALPVAAISAALLVAGPATAENLTFCLTGHGTMVKPALGNEPRHPCIAWQSQITFPALNVMTPPAMTTLEDLPEPTPVEVPFWAALTDVGTHDSQEEEVAGVGPATPPSEHPALGLYVRCVYSGGTGEHLLQWSFRTSVAGVVMSVDGQPSRNLQPFAYVVFESSDDGQNDGSSDDLALRPVPDAGVLAPDGSSISLRNAQAHMNTDEAPCTAVGRATLVDASVPSG